VVWLDKDYVHKEKPAATFLVSFLGLIFKLNKHKPGVQEMPILCRGDMQENAPRGSLIPFEKCLRDTGELLGNAQKVLGTISTIPHMYVW
jgi:hypothetical protein